MSLGNRGPLCGQGPGADAYGDPVEVFDPTEFIAEDDEL